MSFSKCMKKDTLQILLNRIKKLEKKDKETQKRLEKLEKDNEKLKKWALREKKKMDPIKWLNDHYAPLLDFQAWSKTISVEERDLQYLFAHGPVEGIFHIIQKQLPLENRRSFPIVAFKSGHLIYFYIFNCEKWIKMNNEVLLGIFNRTISPRLFQAQIKWEEQYAPISDNMDDMMKVHKRVLKLTIDSSRLPRIITGLRKLLGAYLELNLKNIIEYDFIF